jgi:hypothetical protein
LDKENIFNETQVNNRKESLFARNKILYELSKHEHLDWEKRYFNGNQTRFYDGRRRRYN